MALAERKVFFPKDMVESLETDSKQMERTLSATVRYACKQYLKKCKRCPFEDN